MGNSKNWLKARARNKQLIEKAKRIAAGTLIAAVIVGPLIYFGAVAVPIELRNARKADEQVVPSFPATPEIATTQPATPQVKVSKKPIEFPEPKEEKEIKNPKVEFVLADLPKIKQQREVVDIGMSANTEEQVLKTLKTEFKDEDKDVQIKTTTKTIEGQEEKLLIMENLDIEDGPRKVQKDEDANAVARAALRRYLKTNPQEMEFDIYKDTSKIKNSKKTYQLVVSNVKTNDEKWYVSFQQYKKALPVFDGNVKMIFTERKKLIAITDNIRTELPDATDFQITNTAATETTKEIFEWDETEDKIDFVNKGYYKNKPAYKIEIDSHNPLGEYEVYVNGIDGVIENVTGDIRLADETGYSRDELRPDGTLPYNPATDMVDPIQYAVGERTPEDETQIFKTKEELELQREENNRIATIAEAEMHGEFDIQRNEIFEKIIAAVYAEEVIEIPSQEITGPSIEILEEFSATGNAAATPDATATPEPKIIILDTIFSQVLGKVYPQNPNQEPIITPFANAYVYYNSEQYITDEDGYFENKDRDWYSVFLDGPHVTVYDDDASANADIKDRTPEDPFIWDEDSASLAAINTFYHANEIHDYFVERHDYEVNKKIPITVNSELVDQYLNGCGAWFNNSDKSIEMGRGGTANCPNDLNYALSSDFVYHEYAHFIVEEITHLPNITGSEAAAMGEGLADYFASSINNDSVWGDVVAPNSTRNLKNTLNYNSDMTGESHQDGQIFAGALWDLRTLIGPVETDKLIFNTLYQDRLHFETFMYGMLIEDDDNNDFSDGTPHMLEIIAAFENHGIGPGIANFNGLPVDPEAWTALVGEEAPTGGEDDIILNALGGTGCSGYDNGTTIWIDTNITCWWTGTGTRSMVYLSSGADLYVANSSLNAILTTTGDVSIYGTTATSTLNLGYYATPYGQLTVGDELHVINGGTVTVGWDNGSNANTSTYLHVNGSTQIYKTSSSYTTNNFVAIWNNAASDNDFGNLFVGRSDTSTSTYGNQSYVYVSAAGFVRMDSFRLDNDGYVNEYGYFWSYGASDMRDGSYIRNHDTAGYFYNGGLTLYMYNASYFENDDYVHSGVIWDLQDTARIIQSSTATTGGQSATFSESSWLDQNGGSFNVVGAATFNDTAYADVDGGSFTPTTATFNNSAYINHNSPGSTSVTTVNLNDDSRWNHYSGTTTITDFNINSTADARVNTSGQTLTATNFTLNGSGILAKEYYSASSNGDGNISATSITLNDTSQLRAMRSTGTTTTGSLTINSNAAVTNGAVYQTAGTVNVTGTALLDTDNSLYNIDAGSASFGKLRMDVDSEFQNDGAVSVGVSGISMGCNTALCDGAENFGITSLFTNNYTAGGVASVTITSAGGLFMNNASDFINNTGGSVTATSTGSSIDITDSSEFENYGSVNVYNMRVGWHEVDTTEQGGFYYNRHDPAQGYTDINNDLIVYRGDFTNYTASLASYGVNIDGNVDLEGLAELGSCTWDSRSQHGDLTNFGDIDIGGSVTIHDECGELINESLSGSTTAADATMNIAGSINVTGDDQLIDNNSSLVVGNDIIFTALDSHIENVSDAYDTGVIDIYDDFNIYNASATSFPPYLDNYGTVNVGTGTSADSQLLVDEDSDIYNYAGAIIDLDHSATTDYDRGAFYVNNNATVSNSGDVDANRIIVGSSTNGGTFTNNADGDVHTYYNSSANGSIQIYKGVFDNDGTSASPGSLISDGEIKMYGILGDQGLFYNSKAGITNGVKISAYGETWVQDNSTLTSTGLSTILDIGSIDGLLRVQNGSTFDSTSANVSLGDLTGTATGGRILNLGTFKVNSLYMYDSSIFDNESNATFISYSLVELADNFNPLAPLSRAFGNDGNFDGVNVSVLDDDAIFTNSNSSTANFKATGDLYIRGGKFINTAGNQGADVDGLTTVAYDGGTYTNGELYNYDDFVTNKLYVSGYAINGQSGTDANMTVESTTGTDDMVVTRTTDDATPAAAGRYINYEGDTTVAGQVRVHGQPHPVYEALLQNGHSIQLGDTADFIADEIYIEEVAYLHNYADLDVSNKLWTGDNSRDKRIDNEDTGDIDVNGAGNLWLYNNTILTNYTPAAAGQGNITTTGTMKVLESTGATTVNNYGELFPTKLWNGDIAEYNGGTINNEANGDINVTSDTLDAAVIYAGTINLLQDSAGFDVAGTFGIRGDSTGPNPGLLDATDGTHNDRPASTYGGIIILSDGTYQTEDNVYVQTGAGAGQTGDVLLAGGGLYPAYFNLNPGSTVVVPNESTLDIEDALTINSLGALVNASNRNLAESWTSGGVIVKGITTVNSGGYIISDTTSSFDFVGTVNTAGTMNLADDVKAVAFNQTDGAVTFGNDLNVGITDMTDKLTVSGGKFISYNHADVESLYADPDGGMSDIEVTGTNTLAYFENPSAGGPLECNTDVHGYLDILDEARVYINCDTTSAMVVHAGSPGGTTLVEGGAILVLNTNLETDDMIVGGTGTGLVTHDVVGSSSVNEPTGTIAQIIDVGGGKSQVTTAAASNMENGDIVVITSTTNYNGTWIISNTSLGSTTFEINTSGLATETSGTWEQQINFNSAMLVFDLLVNDDLTINSNGSLNVSNKSYHETSSSTGTFAGTHAGKGQSTTITGVTEYGITTSFYPVATYDLGHPDYGVAGLYNSGVGVAIEAKGGGKMKIKVLGDLVNSGEILANGQSGDTYPHEPSGSGGSVMIWSGDAATITGAISGSGLIETKGGTTTSTTTGYAGGGGRIYIDYIDKSSYTGDITAEGGTAQRSSVLYSAAPGSVFYRWRDPWENQRRGTLVIKGDNTNPVDLGLDGSVNYTDAFWFPDGSDTGPSNIGSLPAGLIEVDSLQIEDLGTFWATEDCASGCLKVQQCITETSSIFYNTGSKELEYNSEHTPGPSDRVGICYMTPDPTTSLMINDSTLGTSNGTTQPSNKTANAIIYDITPDVNAFHNDGELDSDSATTDTDGATAMQMQVASTLTELWMDDTANYTCDITNYLFGFTVDDNKNFTGGSGGADVIIQDYMCTLAGNTSYYWRMRLKDNDTLPGWGMWSQTGTFDVGEGGTIAVTSCDSADLNYNLQGTDFTIGQTLTSVTSGGTATIVSDIDNGADGTLTITSIAGNFYNGDTITDGGGGSATATSDLLYKFGVGTYDSSLGDNFDNDKCSFASEATVTMYVKLFKDDLLTHTVNSAAQIIDMIAEEGDDLPTMDGVNDADTETNEVGFYFDNVNLSEFIVWKYNGVDDYTENYSQLPSTVGSAARVLESNGGYSNEIFDMWLGVFINGLIPDGSDPIGTDPTNTCGESPNHEACISQDGTYSATTTLFLSTTP